MPIIVNIGYRSFVLKNDAAVASLMKAMIGSVELEKKYRDSVEIYWPAKHQSAFSHGTVRADQIFPAEPMDPEITVMLERRNLSSSKNQKLIQ